MPTVADYDRELEETKKKMARLREGRKAAAAKEREQARKWRTATVSTMGELLLESLGCRWVEVDLESLKACLDEWVTRERESIQFRITTEERTPADAKQALDAFKRAQREEKRSASESHDEQESVTSEENEDQSQVTW